MSGMSFEQVHDKHVDAGIASGFFDIRARTLRFGGKKKKVWQIQMSHKVIYEKRDK